MTVSRIIFLSAALLWGLHLFAQDWLPLGDGISSHRVWALFEDIEDDRLYAGGFFSQAGGITVNKITYWDGNHWNSIDSGLTGTQVNTINRWKNSIYIAGYFEKAGEALCYGIARLTDGNWEDLNGGMWAGGSINELVATDSFLYVFGVFDSIGGIAADGMARWDGTNWEAFAPPVIATPEPNNNYIIYDAAFFKGELIVAGNINDDSNTNLNEVAQWNGQEWISLDQGIIGDGIIFDLEIYKGELYAGGWFANPADPQELFIARWDGAQWKRVGGGLSQSAVQIQNMHIWDDKLWVTSGPGQAGGLTDRATIHSWDGTDWCQLKTVDHYGFALGSYRDTLITGTTRYADSVYGQQINYIAKMNMADYTDTCSNISVGVERAATEAQQVLSVFPNPTLDNATVQSNNGVIHSLTVFDIYGKQVSYTEPNNKTVELNTKEWAAGMYVIVAQSDYGSVSKRLVKQ